MAKFTDDVGSVNFTQGPTGGVVDTSTADFIKQVSPLAVNAAKGHALAQTETAIEDELSAYQRGQQADAALREERKGVLDAFEKEGLDAEQLRNINNPVVKRYKKDLDKLDAAIKSGKIKASSVLSRIQSKTKEALAAAPYASAEIKSLLASSSGGVGSEIHSLEKQVASDIAVETAVRQRREKDYADWGIDREDPLRDYLLNAYKQEEIATKRLNTQATTSKHAATILLNKELSPISNASSSAVRSLMQKYGGNADNIPKSQKDQLIVNQQFMVANANDIVRKIVNDKGLYLVDEDLISKKAQILINNANTNISILQGKETALAAETSLKNKQDRVMQEMSVTNPKLFRAVTILKNAGPAGGGLFGKTVQNKLYPELIEFTGLDRASRSAYNRGVGNPYNTAPIGITSITEDSGEDIKEAKLTQESEIGNMFSSMHSVYDSEEDLTEFNIPADLVISGMATSPREYSKQSYEHAIKFYASPMYQRNFKKDENIKTTSLNAQNMLNTYRDEKLLPFVRRDLNSDITLPTTSSSGRGMGVEKLPVMEVLDFDINSSGYLTVRTKKVSLSKHTSQEKEYIRSRIDAVAEDFRKKYVNPSRMFVDAYANIAKAQGVTISNEELGQTVLGGLFPGLEQGDEK